MSSIFIILAAIAKSPIGQACRKTLGIGEFEHPTNKQILDAKKAIVDNA